jgi:hypothetical protein
MKAEDIFLAALEQRTPLERNAYLDSACGERADLRAQVEGLLRSHEQAGSFLNAPLFDSPQTIDTSATSNTRRIAPSSEIPLEFLAPANDSQALGRLGHYEVQKVIGRGGMGVVLRAFDEKLHRVVAIKVMAPQLAASPEARQRFVREAQAAAAVRHDNVVDIHAVEDAGPTPYLVMELIAGISLEEKLKQKGLPELTELLRISLQITEALAAAHRQGLVHRDVKPANILLEDGVHRVKVTDFGLARAVDDVSVTLPGMIAGTPAYMSPEQARGESVDCRSDLFSLGSVIYALCTGQSPFRSGSTLAVLKKVCEESPRPIRELNPYVPDWLCNLVENLLAKDPDERYQSASEVADLLSQFLAFVQQAGTPMPVIIVKSRRKRRKPNPGRPVKGAHRRWLLAAAAALVLLSITFGLTEAGGVTNVAASVTRIFTPTGTLVVETDDPAVKVTVEGDGGLVISGAGPQEVRLRPGKYWLRANKYGKPMQPDRDLVTISRGDKQVVRVRLEGDAPIATRSEAKAELQPFVILSEKGAPGPKFRTLAEAVHAASDGDTIEIRGNGPFTTAPIVITNRSLVIRAGEGFRPVITMSATMEGQADLIWTDALLVVEGLELQHRSSGERGAAHVIIGIKGGPLYVTNCRLISHPSGAHVASRGSASTICEFRNCELVTGAAPSAVWSFRDGRIVMDNCVLAGGGAIACAHRPGQRKLSVRLSRNTLVASTILSFTVADAKNVLEPNTDFDPIHFDLSENIIAGLDSIWLLGKINDPNPQEEQAAMLSRLPLLFAWHEQGNLYADAHRFIAPQPKKLAEWNQFWGQADTGCQQATVKFQGGDLIVKRTSGPERIALEDFRLRADSTGYRAGKDGKDFGADVDLVGPGPAYERWKHTPEYQEWLKATGQGKQPATNASRGAFVVLGDKGETVRKYDTLASAVLNAGEGDTIEIGGNGPFITDPIAMQGRALTIRAGAGFRPVIKLSPEAVESELPLIQANAPLILEGLELQRAPPAIQRSGGKASIQTYQAPLWAANCRFRAGIYANQSPVCAFRNCEFLAAEGGVGARFSSGARFIFENCVHRTNGSAIGPHFDDAALHDISIQIQHSTYVSKYTVLWLNLQSPLPAASSGPQALQPMRLEVSGSIFDSGAMLGFGQHSDFLAKAALLAPAEAEATLLGLLRWRGERNLFVAGSTSIKWHALLQPQSLQQQPPHGPTNLDQWKQFWASPETDSLEGQIRFQGGNLASRIDAALDQLTPDDFRLRPDSPGYRALPDGKDLGADVDLVGPGPAYERWKQTPEYQEWLKETKQNIE